MKIYGWKRKREEEQREVEREENQSEGLDTTESLLYFKGAEEEWR